MQIGRLLTFLVVIMGVALAASLIYVNFVAVQNTYGDFIKYDISKLPPGYDYSCDTPVYGLYITISNNGSKSVSDFSLSITNPLCKGAVPPVPSILLPSQELKLYMYSSGQNGTVTISGNNTMIDADF